MNLHTHEVLDEVATKAARKAVEEMLMRLGIDVGDPISVQADMEFLRTVRGIGETVRRQTVKTTVGIVVTATLGIIGYVLFPHLK